MTVVHSFEKSKARSAAYVDAPWWISVYRQAFPTMESCAAVRGDGWAQRAGIDRVITLSCGRIVKVDEKVRERDYGDILLEVWSDERGRIEGWVRKPLDCDFIAYAIAPISTCYLFPVLPLQRAWRMNAAEWWPDAKANQNGYSIKRAENGRYTTISVAVPTSKLLTAISEAAIIRWDSSAAGVAA